MPALPPYLDLRPYDQLVFQWSACRVNPPGDKPAHFEFLGDPGGDPREPFLVSLLELPESSGTGAVTVYNAGFEKGRLRDLARQLAAYQGRIETVLARIWDLLALVRRGVYHPEFGGSLSIKAVLPALVPGMSYDGMEIAEGGTASAVFLRMMTEPVPEAEKARTLAALRDYCRLDTLAMVRIVEHLAGGHDRPDIYQV